MKNTLALIAVITFSVTSFADCIQDCMNLGHDYNFCEFACRSESPALGFQGTIAPQKCETYEPNCDETDDRDNDDSDNDQDQRDDQDNGPDGDENGGL